MTAASLFTPVTLGSIPLKNRIIMAPLTRSRANSMAVPASFAAEYYAQRASAGLIITEATQVSFAGMGYCRTPGIHTPEQNAAWTKIVERVHQAGGKIVCQLWHVGRVASHRNRGVAAETVSASAVQLPGKMYTDAAGMVDHDMPRALLTSEIAGIAADFANAAANAISAGFDGVEVHSANGYLLHQFLSSNVNQRGDRYGGSIQNRTRMPLEVISAVIARVGADRVGVRISPGHRFNDIREDDMEALYAHYVSQLDKLNLAYLHVKRPQAHAFDIDPVPMARKNFRGKMIACSNYDAASAAALVASGTADAVAFGRAFIANPDLPERIRSGVPLNRLDEATLYSPGEKGYTDYPRLAA